MGGVPGPPRVSQNSAFIYHLDCPHSAPRIRLKGGFLWWRRSEDPALPQINQRRSELKRTPPAQNTHRGRNSASAPQLTYSGRFPVWILLFPDAFLGLAAVCPPRMSPQPPDHTGARTPGPFAPRSPRPSGGSAWASTPVLTRRGEEPEATQDLGPRVGRAEPGRWLDADKARHAARSPRRPAPPRAEDAA